MQKNCQTILIDQSWFVKTQKLIEHRCFWYPNIIIKLTSKVPEYAGSCRKWKINSVVLYTECAKCEAFCHSFLKGNFIKIQNIALIENSLRWRFIIPLDLISSYLNSYKYFFTKYVGIYQIGTYSICYRSQFLVNGTARFQASMTLFSRLL